MLWQRRLRENVTRRRGMAQPKWVNEMPAFAHGPAWDVKKQDATIRLSGVPNAVVRSLR